MALVVLLRGVNVGGHRTFRPSVLARELSAYDVVNVGAAGTFVVRKPGRGPAKFQAELRRRLPFETNVVLCDGQDFMRLESEHPYGTGRARADVVRFVSVLVKTGQCGVPLPITLPPRGAWCVRVLASDGQFVFGEYRRRMDTIRYLGEIDKLFAGQATTRNWNTVDAIIRILKDDRAGSLPA